MNKKGQTIPIGAVILVLLILLIPFSETKYISFTINQEKISEPSYIQLKKPLLSIMLESLQSKELGTYNVEVFVFDLKSCQVYENIRSDVYRGQCNVIFSQNISSITTGMHYEKVSFDIKQNVEIYLILRKMGESREIGNNYARIKI